MIEHDSALIHSTSLLLKGEVWCLGCEAATPVRITDAQTVEYRVVGDSRSGKEGGRECGRSPLSKPSARAGVRGEVRAVIVAGKRGNACGAKDGRKANV